MMTDNFAITPEGFSELHRQNQAYVVLLIRDVILEFQKRGYSGKAELNFASGGIINEVKPTPTLRLQNKFE